MPDTEVNAFERFTQILDATSIFSREFKGILTGWMLKGMEQARERGRKEAQPSGALTSAGDTLQSAASRLAEFVNSYEQGGGRVPYEVRMAVLEAEDAVYAWTEARK